MQLVKELIQKLKVVLGFFFSPEILSFSLDIYHVTWNVPSSHDVQERLIQLEDYSEKNMILRLKEYRRYEKILLFFFSQVFYSLEILMELKIVLNQFYVQLMLINH